MHWPDAVITIVLALGALFGFRRGLIGELSGAIALAAAIVAGFAYRGSLDGFVAAHSGLGPGSAHAIGIATFAIAAYAIVAAIGFALGRVAKLPVINLVNGIGGAAVGLAKGLLLVWAVLFVALFFPLSPDLRRDLRHSALVSLVDSPDRSIDESIDAGLPWYARPLLGPLFRRHHD